MFASSWLIRTPFNSASCFKILKSSLLNTNFTDTFDLRSFCRSLYNLERQLVPQVFVCDRLFTSGVLQQVQRFASGIEISSRLKLMLWLGITVDTGCNKKPALVAGLLEIGERESYREYNNDTIGNVVTHKPPSQTRGVKRRGLAKSSLFYRSQYSKEN